MTERARTKIPTTAPFRITNHKSRITRRGSIDLAMLALVIVWGVNFPIVKIAFREMTPMVFNALRFGGATVLLLAVLWRAGEPVPPKAMWLRLVGLGLVGHAIYQVSFINGLARTTAGNSSLILSMVPLFVAMLSAALPQLLPRSWAAVSWQAWAALAYSTVFSIAVGYVVWYASVKAVGGPRTAVYSNLIPIVTLASSWLLLGETLGPVQAAGAAVVLAGVSLART